jgi:uncharacterized protein with NAD-binding domain and iron-sulfur cluster
MSSSKPIRVAILGGGCGAVSAAYFLSQPALKDRYEVSLYTQGWRLGGKGASARNPKENYRIQEHGLHVLFGFHKTVFGVLKECYDELAKVDTGVRFKTVEQAFSPTSDVSLMQRVPPPAGRWENWHFDFPTLPGKPWDPGSLKYDPDIIRRAITWVKDRLLTKSTAGDHSVGDQYLQEALQIVNRMQPGQTGAETPANLRSTLIEKLRDFIGWFRSDVEPGLSKRPGGFEICALIDLAIAVSIGYVKDVLPNGEAGFDQINDIEYKDWLRKHGASSSYIWTAPVRCLYDLGFAFEGGLPTTEQNGKIAAGVALKVTLLLTLGYKGAPLWRTNAAMGEVIFAPIYRVLAARRNVRINFFHRLKNLTLSGDGKTIAAIELSQQLALNKEYEPIFMRDRLWCWPDQPRWGYIQGGKAMKKKAWDTESVLCTYEVKPCTLRAKQDFDVAILAIPPASLPYCGKELLQPNQKIGKMYQELSSVATQSLQWWLKPSVEELGFDAGRILTSYEEPLSSWADWDQMLACEEWGSAVNSLVFFCGTFVPEVFAGPIPDRDYQIRQSASVGAAFDSWIDHFGEPIWPNGFKGGQFDRSLVVSAYARANVDPSELYVQSFPGSIKHRLQPYGSGIENLYLAGDWTVTEINGGSSETAFQSGKVAAQAIIARYS